MLVALYAFGRTVPSHKGHDHAHAPAANAAGDGQAIAEANFDDLLKKAKSRIPADKITLVEGLEHAVVRGDVHHQQIVVYKQLAAVWDTLREQPISTYYLGEAAKLENSEKSLTFAATSFLNHMDHVQDPTVAKWMMNNATELLKQANKLNPANNEVKLQLAQLLVSSSTPMEGISMLLQMAEEDPNNMDVQMMLGNFAITSGQFDKAIERMNKVLEKQPDNPKALFLLAEAYKNKGDIEKAKQTLIACRKLIKDPALAAEIDEYIKEIH
ncbi:tetratricopeptide repeat protein [Chitinophaga skermanii]|uniref:Tetratricopeptide repeat protein n=2 Tax=Chitinophaga skermanii TaxID=331697 RepID=A0A327QIQ3_9BACT|nr:tetratricopeptide repeat protein [Chitinophaga skermanii]